VIHVSQTEHHDTVTELLPWYVNDTLDESERNLVREHVDNCKECRSEVELLQQIQGAVRTESPAPLVPAPRTEELLATLDQRGSKRVPGSRRQWLAAASIVALIGITGVLTWQYNDGMEAPTRFETATSAPAIEAINYVVELQFVDGIDDATRKALFDALEAHGTARPADNGAYRITLALGSLSLNELEDHVQGIESRPEISTAEVVAVQLPVE
jgi:hypothetical protein